MPHWACRRRPTSANYSFWCNNCNKKQQQQPQPQKQVLLLQQSSRLLLLSMTKSLFPTTLRHKRVYRRFRHHRFDPLPHQQHRAVLEVLLPLLLRLSVVPINSRSRSRTRHPHEARRLSIPPCSPRLLPLARHYRHRLDTRRISSPALSAVAAPPPPPSQCRQFPPLHLPREPPPQPEPLCLQPLLWYSTTMTESVARDQKINCPFHFYQRHRRLVVHRLRRRLETTRRQTATTLSVPIPMSILHPEEEEEEEYCQVLVLCFLYPLHLVDKVPPRQWVRILPPCPCHRHHRDRSNSSSSSAQHCIPLLHHPLVTTTSRNPTRSCWTTCWLIQ
jgi:hypothetical protein